MRTDTPTTSAPRRDIQGLRALAVVAVIGAHAAGWPAGGALGVDVFFVISGFLITGMLLRELRDTGRVSLGSFYARRARRLLPAALVVLAAVSVASWFLLPRARGEETLWDALWAAAFASNWRFAAQGTDYFADTGAVSPLQHFWSLSVEEQFTLVWPAAILLLLAFAGLRRVRIVVGVAAVAIVVASFAWATVQSDAQATVAYFSTLTRAWELAAGAVVAALVPLLRRIPTPLGAALQWVGLAGVIASLLLIDPTSAGFPAPWAAVPVAATALVLAGGVGGEARRRHLFPLSNPVAVFLGDASYSLYLWHFPVVVFAVVLLPASDLRLWIVLGATLVLGLASYLIVEQPLRHAPFLGGMPPVAAPVSDDSPAPAPVVAPEPAPAVATTRPAGWTPGTRYYPGMSRPASATPPPAPVVAPVVTAEPNLVAVAVVPAADDRTSAWRERFAPQVFLATAGLVIIALAGALWGTASGHGPRIALPELAPAASAPVASGDPGADLQAELAAAVTADAWPSLSPSLDRVMASSSGANPAHGCFAPGPASPCAWGSGDAPVHVYVVGDSTAMAYAPAFRRIADDSAGGIRVTAIGMYGCRFTDVLVENDDPQVMAGCQKRKAAVRGMILADRPDLVVMSNAYTLGHTVDGRDLSADALIEGQRREAATYEMGDRMLHLAPPPQGVSLAACYAPTSSPKSCDSAVDGTWRTMEALSEKAADEHGDHALSSLPFTCAGDVCPPFAGTVPTKYDQTHLTVEFAEHIAPALRQALDARGLLAPR
ncbi:acyltransferase family protein [Microbacterium sp. EYE_5]|uniref:acyltransferase family protein n=1 Tax=unclassified Microbacterium TaxID=2609290 RepID=UPI002002F92B|nr:MULTISPECIES: acyltransferase family protein [unclassified Microbacterium]MCK6081263.1 acyltransferase family protein [Microbacterium sp. EYE_382]MCK6086533.1 acyltransferase family protein [Microbacterium sp. EYE_384]MCK6123969.1 acyltransferase family protein [Microbacterium sp. EYE_80]MCK6126878.1 acyltransferase family protein [Microbacterium sp. EYE_79]MCK6142218.1 acyltransferase family protein [Microbacterium sp. EYE_39]